jgi:hypothetical protein
LQVLQGGFEMKKEKEIVLYEEPNGMINQDLPAASSGKTGETQKKLLYFLCQDAEEFLSREDSAVPV